MEIREAEPEEAKKITEELWLPLAQEMEEVSEYNELKKDLDLAATIEHKREKLEDEDSYLFVAEENGELAGFVSGTVKESVPVFSRNDKLSINEIFVKKEFRRQGLASKLLNRILEITEKNSVETVELEVNTENESAQRLYKEHGFETERKKMVNYID